MATHNLCLQAAQTAASPVNYRGIYHFRFNAENLIRPYDKSLSRVPELSLVSLSQELHANLTLNTTAMIGGSPWLWLQAHFA